MRLPIHFCMESLILCIMRVCAYINNGINAGSANCVCVFMQIFETAKHLRRKLRRINNDYMFVSVVHKGRSVGVGLS